MVTWLNILNYIDTDGDITWSYINMVYGEQPYKIYFFDGTGKWKGITGEGALVNQAGEEEP